MRLKILLAGLTLVVAFGGSCGGSDGRSPATTTTSSPVESSSPSPRPTERFQPSTATIEPATESQAAITVEGSYILDLQGAVLYRSSGLVSFSPDSRLVAVSECCTTAGGLAVIDLSTGQREEISGGYVAFVDWSPDGSQLAFSRVSTLASQFMATSIFVWNAGAHESRQLAAVEGFRGLYWSPRGKHVLYLLGGKVNIVDTASGTSSVIMDLGPEAERNESITVQWSPDGDKVAACALLGSSDSGYEQVISVYDVDAQTVSEWGDVDSCQALAWSLDGERLLVGGFSDAYVVTENGRNRLVPSVRDVRWSPSSDQLAYVTDGCVTGEFDLYLSNADGSVPKRLTNTPNEVEEALSWSPDGTRVSFSVSEQIAIVDVRSGEMRIVATSASDTLHLHGGGWSPDGRYLQFGLSGGHGICD